MMRIYAHVLGNEKGGGGLGFDAVDIFLFVEPLL